MFYVHDIEGQKFQGPLEQLVQWGNISRKPRVRALDEREQPKEFQTGTDTVAIAEYQKQIFRDKNMIEPIVHAHQIMSSPVLTISLDTLLVEAWKLLEKESVRQLIVTDIHRKVQGILTERNILERINIIDNVTRDIHDVPVADVISRETISSHPISDIRRIARVLAKFSFDALPVVEDDVLLGIITRGDILRGFAENPKLNLYA